MVTDQGTPESSLGILAATVSSPPSSLLQQILFQLPGEALWVTRNESDSPLPFLPSFRVLVSMSVPAASLSVPLPHSLPLSPSVCHPDSRPVPSLSPWLSHLNHCALVTQPSCLAVAASRAGTAPSYTPAPGCQP